MTLAETHNPEPQPTKHMKRVRTSAQLAQLLPQWLCGPKSPIHIDHLDQAGKVIGQFNLKALTPEQLRTVGAKATGAAVMRSKIQPKDFPGGIRQMHLHYQGDIYLLTAEQWNVYSSLVMEKVTASLAKAGTVSFPELAVLSGITSGMR
jgi:hypothetical protein